MIEIVESKDVANLYTLYEKLNDRTKRHTEQIEELQKMIKELKGGLKNGG